jgi:Ubiquitin family
MNSGTFQLFVKNLHGKTISLMAQYQQTVRALKKQAIAYDGSLQYASWLYAGKKLEDDRTLSG